MRNRLNCSKHLHEPYGSACITTTPGGPVQSDLQAIYGKDGVEQLYPTPNVYASAYEMLSEPPTLSNCLARNLNTPFDRLLLLQAGRVAKAYDSKQKVVKAMAILGMLKAALGRD